MSNLLETLRNLSKTLQKHLNDSAKKGSPAPILCAQIALFTATIFVWKTRLYAEHDSTGITTALSYQIISAVLISNSWRLSQCKSIHRQCGFKVNSIANGVFLILAIGLEKFYEKSLSSLGFALSITVLFLILLVIIQPSTDLGFFGFLIGIIGSVAYNLFGHKLQTWMVVVICFLLLSIRAWLEQYWLGLRVDHQPRKGQSSKLEIIEAVAVAGFHLFWVCNLFRTNCQKIEGPPKSISCALSSVMGMPACVLVFILWFSLAVVRVRSLFQTRPPPYRLLLAPGDEEAQLRPVEMLGLPRSSSAPVVGVLRYKKRLNRRARMSVEPINKTSLDQHTVDDDFEPTEAEPLALHRRRRRETVEDPPYMEMSFLPRSSSAPVVGVLRYGKRLNRRARMSVEPINETSLDQHTVDDDFEPTEAKPLALHRRRGRETVEDPPYMEMSFLPRSRSAPVVGVLRYRKGLNRRARMSLEPINETSLDQHTVDDDFEPTEAEPLAVHRRQRRETVEDPPSMRRNVEEDDHPEEKIA